MGNISLVLLIIGLLLLTGYAAHAVGKRTHVPRVTLLLLLGIISGPYVFHLFPDAISKWFPLIAHMALAMVAFLLGERFYGKDLKTTGKSILTISIIESIFVALTVLILLLISGANIILALLLAGIAPATDPAATYDVAKESNSKGPLTDTLLGVVALDDAWGLIIFSIFLAFAGGLYSGNFGFSELVAGCWEILGSVILGVALGFPMSWLTGRVRKGEPTLLEAAGFVFLCGGIALYFNLSYLLSCMILGVVVANKARHHKLPFREIKGISDPFLALFFFLAGYSFEIELLLVVGTIALAYILYRTIGKIVGGFLGGKLSNTPDFINKGIGFCLIPQAGVAVAMSLVVLGRYPDLGNKVLSIVIASTITFEIIGPVITMWQLRKAHEIE